MLLKDESYYRTTEPRCRRYRWQFSNGSKYIRAEDLALFPTRPKQWFIIGPHYVNRNSEIIPKEIIEKPPSAELKPNQKDQDTLPPYDILDQILHYYVDEGYSMKDILNLNLDPEIVKWVIQAVNRNEYKRRQAAPGLKVTTKAFGIGRRMPIAAKYEA